jgi:hypothetical protein
VKLTRRKIYVITVGLMLAIATALGIASAIGGSEPRDPTVVSGGFADLAAHVSAINHERRASDALPTAAQQALARIPKAELPADAIQNARRVFDGAVIGPVFVVPANHGFALVSNGGISLVPGTLGDANPAAGMVEQRSSDDPVVVFGVAADNVVRVDVVIAGKTSQAKLIGNGYEWVADTPVTIDDIRLLLHLSDGSVVRS